MLTFVATDLQLHKIFNTMQVPFFGTQYSALQAQQIKTLHYITY